MSFKCAHCGQDIPTKISGTDYGRVKRFDARFCSERCKIDHHNLKRKIERKRLRVELLQTELQELEGLMVFDKSWRS